MLHAKEALKSIPEEEDEEDIFAGEGGSVDSMSSEGADEDEWLQVPSHFSLEDAAKDLRKKYKEFMEEVEPEDPIQRENCSLLQGNLEDVENAKCWINLCCQRTEGMD